MTSKNSDNGRQSLQRLSETLEELKAQFGAYSVDLAWRSINQAHENSDECTIIANAGAHKIPEEIMRGTIHIVYEGTADLSSAASAENFITEKLFDLGVFLKSKNWKNVYLIISGHCSVCVQIKMLVYRITHIETTDVIYNPGVGYFDLTLDTRRIATGAE